MGARFKTVGIEHEPELGGLAGDERQGLRLVQFGKRVENPGAHGRGDRDGAAQRNPCREVRRRLGPLLAEAGFLEGAPDG